jgi:hypothetical protein
MFRVPNSFCFIARMATSPFPVSRRLHANASGVWKTLSTESLSSIRDQFLNCKLYNRTRHISSQDGVGYFNGYSNTLLSLPLEFANVPTSKANEGVFID